jgi:hypothetical protein
MLVLLIAASAFAAPLDRDPEGVGLGIILGEPTGFSAAWRPEGRFWVDGGLAWSLPSFAQLHVDACLDLGDFRTADLPDMHFPLWVGVGPRFRVGAGTGYDAFNMGIRVPIGFGFWHDGLPIEGFLELAPGVGVYPNTEFIFDGGVGARFFLPIANGGKRYSSPEPDPY